MSRNRWFGFIAYCTLAGSTWLLEGISSGWPALLRLSVHDALVGGVFASAALARREPWLRTGWERLAGWGALLLAGPAVLLAGAGSSVNPLSETLVFALVPAFTDFILAQHDQDGMRLLLPALTGVGGLALVVPFALPTTWFGTVWLALLVGCAGSAAFAGIKLHAILSEGSLLWAGAIAAGAAALLAAAGWAGFEQGPVSWSGRSLALEAGWALLVDAPLALLLLWLLRVMPPVGLAARFTAVPLVTILGGLAMLRPAIGWTTGLGLTLGLWSVWMLVRDAGEAQVEPI